MYILEIRYKSGMVANHEYSDPWMVMADIAEYTRDAKRHNSIIKITLWPKGKS